MASVFKRRVGGPWVVSYQHFDLATGKVRRREVVTQFSGARQKKLADAKGVELERRARAFKRGELDLSRERLAVEERRDLTEHLDEYLTIVESKGRTPEHLEHIRAQIEAVCDACGFQKPVDIDAVAVARYVTEQKALGVKHWGNSNRTLTARVMAVEAFIHWLVAKGRLTSDPYADKRSRIRLNADQDRRYERRPLTDDEAFRLIAAAEKGDVVLGMSGADRALVYRFGLSTGFRANEIRTLHVKNFDLADPVAASVTVESVNSKSRRRDTNPINADLAERLAAYIESRPGVEHPFGDLPQKTAVMIRRDLEAAKIELEVDGRVVDFHSLRETFATRCARNGVPLAMTQKLLRHSTPTLTAKYYVHFRIEDKRAELAKLPPFEAETERASRATTQKLRKSG